MKLDELENLNILVGKNSSGKSNLVEVLCFFFNDFSVVGGNTAGLNDYYWFDRKTNNPIEFIIDIEMTDTEVNEMIPSNLFKEIKGLEEESNLLHIRRIIKSLQGSWETSECYFIALIRSIFKPISTIMYSLQGMAEWEIERNIEA